MLQDRVEKLKKLLDEVRDIQDAVNEALVIKPRFLSCDLSSIIGRLPLMKNRE